MFRMNNRMGILCLIMLLVVVTRAFAPLSKDFVNIASFSCIGAVALFGGAYFKRFGQSMLMPLVLLFLSDLLLILTMGFEYAFNGQSLAMYSAFILMTLVGRLMIKKVNIQNVVLASLIGVFIHWIVTDFAVWYGSPFFAQNLIGFWEVLVLAIPFERTFLISTLLYSAIMFGSFEWIKVKFPKLALQKLN